jgi:hypothetical protein
MHRTIALVLGLALCLGLLSLPRSGAAQPCPPGMIWTPGGCRPAPPPPRYVPPPPGYAAPPVYDNNLKQVERRYVTLRTCPGEGCPPVTTLSRGTPVHILAWEGRYVFVRVPGSPIEGWVKRNRLTP